MKDKKVNLTIFRENNREKTILKDCAFMNCPYCNSQLFLQTDKITSCRTPKCKFLHKVVYKLRLNLKTKEGFDKVLVAEVEDYKKTTLWEAFKDG